MVDGRLVEQLVGRAREQGVALTGESGLLGQLSKLVLESALEGELTVHVGYVLAPTENRASIAGRLQVRAATITRTQA